MLEFIYFFYFMQTHEKETQLGDYVLCAKSTFVRQGHRVLPPTRGLIVGFFDLKHVPVPLSAADTISSAGPRVGPRSPPPQTN